MELLVLNQSFESIAVIDNYKSMIWTDRYNAYGDFEICFAMDIKLLNVLKEDYYIWSKDSEHCISRISRSMLMLKMEINLLLLGAHWSPYLRDE